MALPLNLEMGFRYSLEILKNIYKIVVNTYLCNVRMERFLLYQNGETKSMCKWS